MKICFLRVKFFLWKGQVANLKKFDMSTWSFQNCKFTLYVVAKCPPPPQQKRYSQKHFFSKISVRPLFLTFGCNIFGWHFVSKVSYQNFYQHKISITHPYLHWGSIYINSTFKHKSIQSHTESCWAVQNPAKPCRVIKATQNHAEPCSATQNDAEPCTTTQNHA